MARIVAVSNIKGGVGKTTTTANLAAALAARGHKVLAVDLDPQASLTASLGYPPEQLVKTIREALDVITRPIENLLLHTKEGFDLVPANGGLRTLEPQLEDGRVQVHVLRTAVDPLRDQYDFILIDCPANAGILTGNALAAANEVLIPFQPDFLAFQSMKWFMRVIQETRAAANPGLRIAGLLLTFFDPRSKHTREVIAAAHKVYGAEIPIFSVAVPLSSRFREAPAWGSSVFHSAPDSEEAETFRRLAAELEQGVHATVVNELYFALQHGREALAAGDLAKAYIEFCRATEMDPQQLEAWVGRGESAHDWDEAIRSFAQALRLDGENTEVRARADRRLRNQLEHSTTADEPAMVRLARFLERTGQGEYAEQLYRQATQLAPIHLEAWLGLARTALDVKEGWAAAEQALRLDSHDKAAQEMHRQAVDRKNARAVALVEEGRALVRANNSPEAHLRFQEATDLDPLNEDAWLSSARTAADLPAARGYIRRLLQINPNHLRAREMDTWLRDPEGPSRLKFRLSPALLSTLLALAVIAISIYLILNRIGG